MRHLASRKQLLPQEGNILDMLKHKKENFLVKVQVPSESISAQILYSQH